MFGTIIKNLTLNIQHQLQIISKEVIKTLTLKPISALKVAWVTRLLDDNFHPWKIIPAILFTNFGGINNVFRHNFRASKQCRSKVSRLPKFYQELIQLWSEVGERKCSNASEICGEVLWNNAWIVSNGETLYNKHFVDKGTLTVRNIIDEFGRPLCWAEAKQKYDSNNSHVFNWCGLIKSIQRNWKNILCTNPGRFTADIQNHISNVSRCITSKVAYQKLLKQLVKPQTAQKSMERMFGLEDVDWSRVYLLPRATTIESSLRSFQYKILNNNLYLNERLFKLNAVESPQCSLCKQFPESVLHLFCTWSVTRSLWVQFCSWASNANILLTSDLDPQYCTLGLKRGGSVGGWYGFHLFLDKIYV